VVDADPHPVLSIAGPRTLIDVLATGAAQHPDRELLVFDDVDGGVASFTWADVLAEAQVMARRLRGCGLAHGDRLHLHMANRPEFLFAWFACAAIGATIVPTNTQSSPHEIAFAIGHSGARLSLADADGEADVLSAAQMLDRPHEVHRLDRLPEAPATDRVDPNERVTADMDLGLLYTSGTTSRPKAVRITHANYVFAGEVVARNVRIGPEDRVLTVLPLFHANAQYYTVMSSLVARATIVLVSRFSASRLLDQIVAHDVTVASLFAAPIRMVLAQEPTPAWRRHRLRVVLFAQSLTDAEAERWDRLIGAPLVQLYGMTETIGPPVINPLDGERRPKAMGRVALGYVCRVVREDGAIAAVGEIGQLCVQGVPGLTLMRGYLDDATATGEALQDGWLLTGDIVRVEPGGFLSFVDRRKDMIKRGGENIAASEVEAVLRSHAAVADAAVFGVPDPIRDERVIAAVVLSPDGSIEPEELVTWCAERLARFRVPSRVMILGELPRTPVGKVRKHVLAEEFLAGEREVA
jgi:crotonobetaine/carnitine-CoA ligase